MVSPQYIIGLDLHGTLLEPGEIVRPEMVEPAALALQKLEGRVARFLCTGNDLAFVQQKVPGPILQQIDGHVLETGCSASLDKKTEEVLTSPEELETIRKLEALLRKENFPELDYFAHRLTTISMFCDRPREFFKKVAGFVGRTPFSAKVHVTYSSVAVDIIPAGYDKFSGLKKVAGKMKTIGIADSMNDRALLEKADFAFAPSNLAPELTPVLEAGGRLVKPLAQADGLVDNVVWKAKGNETEGVVEILEFLDRWVII